jgi:hypothetical protein
MGLKVGIDFGTSTTCVAVLDPRTLQPRVEAILDSGPLLESAVWIARSGDEPIVQSSSTHRRHPRAVAALARRRFESYWRERMEAHRDFVTRAHWERADREADLLLTHFKPELADSTAHNALVSVTPIEWFDQMSQSTIVYGYRESVLRLLANPSLTRQTTWQRPQRYCGMSCTTSPAAMQRRWTVW